MVNKSIKKIKNFLLKCIVLFTLLFGVFDLFSQVDTVLIPEVIEAGKVEIETEIIQWAKEVLSFSSEYSSKIKSAKQVLGKPNVISGPSPCAWAPSKKSRGNEFIKVKFNKPIKVRQVFVHENHNPSAIERIILHGKEKGDTLTVYKAQAKLLKIPSRSLNIFIPETPFEVERLTMYLNSEEIKDFEIDAIAISSSEDTIKVKINIPPGMMYKSEKESLGSIINTEYDERSPVISADGKEIYFVRKNHPQNFGGKKDEDDIWYSKLTEKGWLPAINLGPPLNNAFNNFVQSVSPDGNTLLLANNYVRMGANVVCLPGVSISHRTATGWSFPQEVKIKNFKNLSQYVNFFLSADGKYLLIAMEGEDSYGGLDLYVSFRLSEYVFSEPINLGPIVNTAANDFSPFLAPDGVTLYYSTSGWPGFGSEDIFMTRRLDDSWKNWTEPINLGKPINSEGSDTKFSIPASGNYAYFTSTEGSLGLNDIFRVLIPDTIKPLSVVLVSAKVIDVQSKKPIHNASIECININNPNIKFYAKNDSLTGNFKILLPAGNKYTAIVKSDGYINTKLTLDFSDIDEYMELTLKPIQLISKASYRIIKGKIYDKLTNQFLPGIKVILLTDTITKKILASTFTNEKGEFILKLENVDELEKIFLLVESENYKEKFIETDLTSEIEFNYDIDLEINEKFIKTSNKITEINTINFTYGKTEITPEVAQVLDRVYKMLNEYPNMVIEIGGYADSQSSSNFNMKLSLERAKKARDYLIKKGINPNRIKVKAYGKSRPLINCKEDGTCTPLNDELNRRIDLRILKLDKKTQLNTIHYKYGKFEVTDSGSIILNKIAELMSKYPQMIIEISGHTCVISSFNFNLNLSKNRAIKAKEYLLEKGIDSRRIITNWYGETQPLNNCIDEDSCPSELHSINRRIELRIVYM